MHIRFIDPRNASKDPVNDPVVSKQCLVERAKPETQTILYVNNRYSSHFNSVRIKSSRSTGFGM